MDCVGRYTKTGGGVLIFLASLQLDAVDDDLCPRRHRCKKLVIKTSEITNIPVPLASRAREFWKVNQFLLEAYKQNEQHL